MRQLLLSVSDSFLALAYPQPCHACGSEVKERRLGVGCSKCWLATELFSGAEPACPKCGAVTASVSNAFACRNCEPHYYDIARSLGVYEHALSSSIVHLKRVPTIPKFLLTRIPAFLDAAGLTDCDLIVPVPISSTRLSERGFNQAEVIANAVGQILDRTVDSISLSRTKHTPMHRAAMDKRAREATVQNAFRVVRPKLIAGQSILLVDDIFTSGATASNCSKALKKKGAAAVNIFTLARAM